MNASTLWGRLLRFLLHQINTLFSVKISKKQSHFWVKALYFILSEEFLHLLLLYEITVGK